MQNKIAFILLATLVCGLYAFPTDIYGQIGTSNIQNNAITSPKIRDGAVKTPDIANNAVTTSKISNGAVETSDLADDAVTSDKIEDGSITAADLSPNTLGSGIDKLKAVSKIIFSSCSIDFPYIPPQQFTSGLCHVTGAQVGDKVIATSQNDAAGIVTQSASVNATDLVRMSIRNPNPIATHPPKVIWAVIIFRQ
jgi:hypothetical protein